METFGEIRKNAREIIRASMGNFKGRQVFDLRVCYEAEPGLYRPGPKGLAFSPDILPQIIEVLKIAQENIEEGKNG